MHEVRYLDPAALRIYRVPGGAHPRVEIEGDRTILQARFKRVFPYSRPDLFFSIQDGSNKEIGILRDLEALRPEERSIVAQELDRRYYTPTVRKIRDIRKDSGMFRFEVDTDRGPATYFVRNWRDSAHEVMPGRWQILGVDGQRFQIEDFNALDKNSQNLLYQELF